jgi:hypothetical protein
MVKAITLWPPPPSARTCDNLDAALLESLSLECINIKATQELLTETPSGGPPRVLLDSGQNI